MKRRPGSIGWHREACNAAYSLPAALLLVCSLEALAQGVAPSQITPPSLLPPLAPPAAPLPRLPNADVDLQPTADDALELTPGSVQVEGAPPGAAEVQALRAALTGRRTTLGEIRRRGLALEQIYAARGLFLVRVVLPPQRLVDGGPLRIVVVDGVVGSVNAEALPAAVRAAVERMLAPLIGQHQLSLAEAERRLLLAGSLAGLSLRSTLAAGADAGTTQLVLDGSYRPVDASVRIANSQPRSLGTLDLQMQASLNSLLGAGERLYATLGGGRGAFDGSSHGDWRLAGIGAVAPLGTGGLTFNPEYTRSTTSPLAEAGALRTYGRLERTALRLGLPALPTSQGAGYGGQFAIEHIAQSQQAADFGIDLNRDRYSVLRIGADAAADDSAASLTWSHGLGGRDADQAEREGVPLSRLGAKPRFDAVAVSVRTTQPLGGRWSARLVGLGQTSFGRPLLLSEQFALSGPDAVSGYTSGVLSVDQGATLRGEVRPGSWAPAGVAAVFEPYAFAAGGKGRVFQPTAAERQSFSAGSVGFGLRAASRLLPVDLHFELARRFGAPDSEVRLWRVQVSLRISV